MLRTIGAVILGYIVLVLIVFASFSLVYLAMGPSFAFRPGTVEVTIGWMVMSTVVSFLAAWIGGMVATRIGRSRGAVYGLAGLVLVLGLISAGVAMSAAPPALPDRPLSTLEAASFARQPTWYGFLVAFVGTLGVLAGGGALRRPAVPAESAAPHVP